MMLLFSTAYSSIIFNNFSEAKDHLQKTKYPLVIKADGLCMGKGVAVCKIGGSRDKN